MLKVIMYLLLTIGGLMIINTWKSSDDKWESAAQLGILVMFGYLLAIN
jgi:hypothetical protein